MDSWNIYNFKIGLIDNKLAYIRQHIAKRNIKFFFRWLLVKLKNNTQTTNYIVMSKWLKFFLGIIISIIFLFIIFRNVDFGSLFHIIKTVKLRYLIYVITINICCLYLRSFRWRMFIPEYRGFSIKNFFESTTVGLMFNVILPFRAGDFVQGYLLAKKIGLPKSLTFSTVLMERFIDFFPPIIFIIIGSFFVILPVEISLPLIILILICLTFGFVFLIKIKNVVFQILNQERYTWVKKVSHVVKNFYSGIENFKDIKLLLKIVPLTLCLWLGYSWSMVLFCKALNIALPSFWAGILVQSVTALSVVIPSSPGYIGTWEFMAMLALKIFGVGKELSLAFALLTHFVGMVIIVVIGLYYFIKEFTLIKEISYET